MFMPPNCIICIQNAVRVKPENFGSMKQSNSTRTRKCAKPLLLQAKTQLVIFGSTRTSSHFAYITIFEVAKLCIFVSCSIRFGQVRQCAGPSEIAAIAHTTARTHMATHIKFHENYRPRNVVGHTCALVDDEQECFSFIIILSAI